MKRPLVILLLVMGIGLILKPAQADGPGDNNPQKVRRVPRLGVELSGAETSPLLERVQSLDKRMAKFAASKSPLAAHLPDVRVFARSVREAIEYREMFDKRDLKVAAEVLGEAEKRMAALEAGAAPWTRASGLVVRGFISKLDGTVQPLGLVIPKDYSPGGPQRRLDVWFHGRGETVSEMRFIHQRMRNAGVFQPTGGIVLHPYGRYSNAFKFAGEVDTLETIDFVKSNYSIDPQRIAVRGFSMGGAGCWQFAVHYADRWFAANPGAGFSETPEFLRSFQQETLHPTWWERDLWHWYDCTDWSPNLMHCPTVAYSGELDIQKQAADIMAQSLAAHGVKLTHVIGPQTKHRYHPAARDEVERRMTAIARYGRSTPREVRLVTYTLKYNSMHWVRATGLQTHWKRAEVNAAIINPSTIRCTTENISDLQLETPSGWRALAMNSPVTIEIDGQTLTASSPESDRSFGCQLHKHDGHWRMGERPTEGLRKRHGLQGPIDDAFMDSFLFVEPSGKANSPQVEAWTQNELKRSKEHWRRHFRGHARSKRDTAVTADDIANHNLILWGDPGSNKTLASIVERLPIRWRSDTIKAGEEVFNSKDHVLIMVYPNPLNPERYIVLNSSFTFRDYAYLNNARQTAKLPDWAVVQTTDKPDPKWPTTRWPGRIVGANFFDEAWRLRPAKKVDAAPEPF